MAVDEAKPDGTDNKRTIKYAPAHLLQSQIPDGAVLMAKDEVRNMHMKMIEDHKPRSDTWPFRFGGSFCAIGSAMAGMLINSHFRYKFVLRNHAVFQTYLPIVMLPMLASAGFQIYIKSCVIVQSACPTCISIRAGTVQALTSCVYSVCIAAPLCIQMSKTYHTYVLTKNNFMPNAFHALKTKRFAWYCYFALIIFNFGVGYSTAHIQGKALEKVIGNNIEAFNDREPNIAWK